jgi:hypothetical protein
MNFPGFNYQYHNNGVGSYYSSRAEGVMIVNKALFKSWWFDYPYGEIPMHSERQHKHLSVFESWKYHKSVLCGTMVRACSSGSNGGRENGRNSRRSSNWMICTITGFKRKYKT